MENKRVWREDPGDLNYSNGGEDIDEQMNMKNKHLTLDRGSEKEGKYITQVFKKIVLKDRVKAFDIKSSSYVEYLPFFFIWKFFIFNRNVFTLPIQTSLAWWPNMNHLFHKMIFLLLPKHM